MPTVYNGIGTWYWGRSDGLIRRGICENCGNLAALKSYDTQMFFVIFFLPIVPLGRKRIVDECPLCKRHRSTKQREWQQGRREVQSNLLPAAEQNPQDLDAVRAALAGSVVFQYPDGVDRMVALIERYHPQSPEFLYQLGDACSYFSRHAEAQVYFERAYQLDQNDDIRLDLATNAIELGQPDRAWELLREGPDDRNQERAGRLVAVAESYQSFGMHDAALTVLETVLQIYPESSKWPEYKRIFRTGTKYKDSDKKLAPKMFAPLKAIKSENTAANLVARFVPLVVLLVVVGGYLLLCLAIGASREVYFVNGLSKPYTVDLGEAKRTLQPGMATVIQLSEGTWQLQVTQGVSIEPQEISIATRFWSRPFIEPTFVVNPDRSALIDLSEVSYAEDGDDAPDPRYELFVGEFAYTFWDVDYPFEEFPDSISLPAGDPVTKRGLRVAAEVDEILYEQVVLENFDIEKATEVIRRWKQYEEES
jgi:tetratricopeptide (TPR) repeat protein